MKLKLIIIFLLSATIVSGCRSSKHTSAVKETTTATTSGVAASDAFGRITASYRPWTDVSVPVTIKLTSPTKFSISGRSVLVRGKSIDISLRVLGFEMGRAFVTSDSAFVIIKPQRTYMAESLDELTKYVSFTTENIQDLLLGRPFLLGQSTMGIDDRKLVEIETFEQGTIIKPQKQPSMAGYGYAANLDEVLTNLIIVGEQASPFKAQVNYSGHAANTPAGVVASDADMEVSTGKTTYAASFEWKWNNAKWNSGAKSDFDIPQGYKRVRAKDLLKGALPK